MKKFLLVSILSVSAILQVSAQVTALGVTATIVAPTVCTAPCNGSATAIVTGGTPPYTYLWNIPLAPQMTQTATGLCPGTYQCGVFDSSSPLPNQGQALVTVTCSTASGVAAVTRPEGINVFPNPASNVLNLEINTLFQGNAELTVRNVLGEVALTGSVELSGLLLKQLDISALPAGIYTVEIVNNERAIRSKFIKQ